MGAEEARAGFLINLIEKYVRHEGAILEIGCKGGRNLDSLYRAGFTEITGLEESSERVRQIEERFPGIWERVRVIQGPPEELTGAFGDDEFDLVFSVGYFEEDLDYERLYDAMARVTARYVLTIEDERDLGEGGHSRDFRETFEKRGLRQINEVDIAREPGLESVFYARVFEKD